MPDSPLIPPHSSPPPSPMGLCPKCSYPIDPGVCPECGTVTTDPELLTVAGQRRHRAAFIRKRLFRAIGLGLVIGIIPLAWSIVAVVLFAIIYPAMTGLQLDTYPRNQIVGDRLFFIALVGTQFVAPALVAILCTVALLLSRRWLTANPHAKRQCPVTLSQPPNQPSSSDTDSSSPPSSSSPSPSPAS